MMLLDSHFLREKALRDVEKNWHYIPACTSVKKRLATEEQARAYAEQAATFEMNVFQAWLTKPLTEEDYQVYAACFVPAFLEVWQKLHPEAGVEQPTLWEVA